MDLYHDIHIHTNLSLCGKEDATVKSYIDLAYERGLKTIGFSDHLWDKDVEGASDWYRVQDIDHVYKIRENVPEDTKGIKLLFGCETEFLGGTQVGITREHANLFDYILIPTSHIHMVGFIRPSHIITVNDIRSLLLQRFKEAASLIFDVPVGMAHPFCPVANHHMEDEILRGITDDEYKECFYIAAKTGKSIEIQACVLANHLQKDEHDYSVEYSRMFSIALQEGCLFHLGSDAHSPFSDTFNAHARLREFASFLGIKNDNLMQV